MAAVRCRVDGDSPAAVLEDTRQSIFKVADSVCVVVIELMVPRRVFSVLE